MGSVDRLGMRTTLVEVTESANWRVEYLATRAFAHGFYALTPDQEKPSHFFGVFSRGAGPKGSASEWSERFSAESLSELADLLIQAQAKATACEEASQ